MAFVGVYFFSFLKKDEKVDYDGHSREPGQTRNGFPGL